MTEGTTMTAEREAITQADIEAASAETERLTRELDITNADHVALWLESNIAQSGIGFVAVRIVEAATAVLTKQEAWAALRSLEQNPEEARSEIENSAVEKLDAIYRASKGKHT